MFVNILRQIAVHNSHNNNLMVGSRFKLYSYHNLDIDLNKLFFIHNDFEWMIRMLLITDQ